MVYCVDDGLHTVQKFSLDGKLLMTLGSPNHPAPKWQGDPFNRPTHVAVSPVTGHLYVSDGYGNSKVHKFSLRGGTCSPGARRALIRVSSSGHTMWLSITMTTSTSRIVNATVSRSLTRTANLSPCGTTSIARTAFVLITRGNFFIGELNGIGGVDDAPGLGHRVSIYNLQGHLQSRIGEPEEGEGPTQFIAPHGVAVDSRGDLYVGDVAYTIRGQRMNPPNI